MRANELLHASETRLAYFHSLAENSQDFIGLADLDGNVFYLNQAAMRLVGLPDLDAVRRTRIPDYFFPEDRLHIDREFLPAIRRDGHARGEIRFRHFATGAAIWMEHNAVLVNDAAGNPAGLATMSYDISGRRDAQLALEAANAELERKVASRTEELQAALDRALAADRLKSEFVAHMSHELRTPLNAILGFTGTLLLRLPGPLNSDQIRQLETIQSSARHLLALINDLLDVSKIESGKTEAYLEPVACQAVVMDVVNALSDEAVRKGLVLDTALPDEPVVVRSDRRLLRQIVLNLLGNAIKFTDTGSVRVSVSRGDVRLGETACIVVADTACIPPRRPRGKARDSGCT
jgi:PAS domain S-box-containing protein